MPALEPVEAWRVVASPEALDRARWHGDDVDVLRIAPDEALGLGATGVELTGDPDAIVEPEAGYSVAILDQLDEPTVRDHVEWDLDAADELAQGKVAGVPAKLRVGNPTLLVVQTAYADELRERLGW
ncbi:MAG TPA: hypothetical protein VFR93_01990 [Candidatus Limnocylindrales bacterium]|nr:hypothetical protein [Candidatus Limnocylindrales bacterium]